MRIIGQTVRGLIRQHLIRSFANDRYKHSVSLSFRYENPTTFLSQEKNG